MKRFFPLMILCAAPLIARAQDVVVPDATLPDTSTSAPTQTIPSQTVPTNGGGVAVAGDANVSGADIASTPINAGAGLADARNLSEINASRISIIDAIVQTINNNPQRTAALAALRAAEARIGIARAAGGLQVGLTGSENLNRNFGGTSSSSSSSFSTGTGGTGTGGTGTGGTGGIGTGTGSSGGFSTGTTTSTQQVFGFNSNQSIGVDATLPIFSGGSISANKRVARFNERAQAAQTLQVSQDLVRTTIETYLNILRSAQLLDVAQSNLDVSRERSRVANVRFFAGAAARLETLRADATLADAAQRRVDASTSLAQFKSALNILMGRKPETPLRIVPISTLTPRVPIPTIVNASSSSEAGSFDELSTPASGAATPIMASIAPPDNPSNDPLYALAIANRPEGVSFEEQLRAAEANIDVAKAARRPSLGLSLGAFLRNPTSFAGRFALSLGLSVAQSLFDSGRTTNEIREARALADQARANEDLSRLQVANQIESELLNLNAATKRVQLATTGVLAAQEALRAAQLGYAAGAQTSLDVSDAQTALLTAQQQEVNARFDVANAQSNLSAAIGVLTTEGQTAYELALQQEMKTKQK